VARSVHPPDSSRSPQSSRFSSVTILSLENVSKGFGLKPLLEDVTFSLEHDEKMGIIGVNGSGKSTLLRIIAGTEAADGGRVMFGGDPVVAYLPQEPDFQPGTTVLDAVFDGSHEMLRLLHDYEAACHALDLSGGMDAELLAKVAQLSQKLDVAGGWDLEAQAKAILTRLGVTDMDARVETLSGGQRKRIAMARALILQPSLLILDEPTNHLDAETIAWLEGYLKSFNGAVLLITHDRYFLDRVTNRMLEIENGVTQRFEGNYTQYLELKAAQQEQREAEGRRRDNLMRRELAWLRRGAKARTTKQKARVDRAHALMADDDGPQQQSIELSAASSRLGKRVIDLQNVGKSFGDLTVLEGFTHQFTRGDRIGIIGPNGSGKTTLLEIIAGRLSPDEGDVEIGQTAVIGYYDQESRALKDDLRVIDYIKEVAEYVRTADGQLITASQMLERFLFPGSAQYTEIGRLSGGERRRLYLLRVLMRAPNILMLDEPTNDLDIPTLVALEDYLDGFDGTLIVASHDRYFLDRTVDHIFRFESGGNVRKYPGNYSAFLETFEAEAASAEKAQKVSKPARQSQPKQESNGAKKLTYRERLELEEIEARIEASEERKTEIEASLANPPDDTDAITAMSAELEALSRQLEADMDRWAELAERAG
jgi:ABC transport system ATP-binding/permease protein